jgi:hypothetical protein
MPAIATPVDGSDTPWWTQLRPFPSDGQQTAVQSYERYEQRVKNNLNPAISMIGLAGAQSVAARSLGRANVRSFPPKPQGCLNEDSWWIGLWSGRFRTHRNPLLQHLETGVKSELPDGFAVLAAKGIAVPVYRAFDSSTDGATEAVDHQALSMPLRVFETYCQSKLEPMGPRTPLASMLGY